MAKKGRSRLLALSDAAPLSRTDRSRSPPGVPFVVNSKVACTQSPSPVVTARMILSRVLRAGRMSSSRKTTIGALAARHPQFLAAPRPRPCDRTRRTSPNPAGGSILSEASLESSATTTCNSAASGSAARCARHCAANSLRSRVGITTLALRLLMLWFLSVRQSSLHCL